MKERIQNAREGPQGQRQSVRNLVRRLDKTQAEAAVAMFEMGKGTEVDSDTVQLLERYFLEHDDAADLSHRYDEALKKYAS